MLFAPIRRWLARLVWLLEPGYLLCIIGTVARATRYSPIRFQLAVWTSGYLVRTLISEHPKLEMPTQTLCTVSFCIDAIKYGLFFAAHLTLTRQNFFTPIFLLRSRIFTSAVTCEAQFTDQLQSIIYQQIMKYGLFRSRTSKAPIIQLSLWKYASIEIHGLYIKLLDCKLSWKRAAVLAETLEH